MYIRTPAVKIIFDFLSGLVSNFAYNILTTTFIVQIPGFVNRNNVEQTPLAKSNIAKNYVGDHCSF